ncbi:murein hydrolase activator EnvC family protein [Ferrimonas senticii]|uniref:murein hydrolase activator EnvC family protein n=1 Tax=Ferrimonas senticii TaxID=394566 RepID=UPI0004114951|nr:peptidoglycan DD-metalloendopeptidase family protein [Ferrimonas senticii]
MPTYRWVNPLVAALLSSAVAVAMPVAADDVEQQQRQLDKITEQIKRQQSALSKGQVNRDKQLKALRKSEKAVSNSTQQLRDSNRQLQQAETKLKQLQQQQTALEKQRQQEQQQLAQQLRGAFMSGNSDSGALLLGGDNPADLDRMLVYYQYLNDARIGAIDKVKATEAQLQQVAQQQQQVRDQQAALVQQQQRQQQQLKRDLDQRQLALDDLQQQLQQQQRQLAQLQGNRDTLAAAIDQALQLLQRNNNYPGLKANGSQPWPLSARISKAFGSHRQGQLTWNGWLMAAPAGREVQAIADGQVIFADWLRGYGLVVVVDHGEEFLSLYGHAQALLKQVGDPVSGGEVLALSGNSGGVEQPGLYFEIRHRGRAVDPKRYLSKS